jgi:methyl-accepting chemotaxis protein
MGYGRADPRSAQNGANVIENSILMIDRIAQGMGAVSTDISRLNNQSESIDDMVETIRKFAMQTRLIALNAAIEGGWRIRKKFCGCCRRSA